LKTLIPGGTALEVRASAPDSLCDNITGALQSVPGATKVDRLAENGEFPTWRMYAEAANTLIGPAAQAVLACGVEVRDLSVKRPSLEEVFIFLTGRHLR
jgi:ABC-2 type transport system ATP-binding protein